MPLLSSAVIADLMLHLKNKDSSSNMIIHSFNEAMLANKCLSCKANKCTGFRCAILQF